jgi:soluble lytic murein transglycosylase
MKLYNILAVILLSLYIPLNVDPAVNPHIDLMQLEHEAMILDKIIETSYRNETAPIRAIELDFKIQEQSQHGYTEDEIKDMSYDILLVVDKKFVMKKMKLAGKKNQKKELEKLAKAIARNHGISPNMFAALIKAESNYNIKALSKKGATGLCQILPDNFKRLDIKDPYDPIQNMNGGAKFFKELSKMFDGNISYTLAAYNAGPGAVQVYNGVPPYSETEQYIEKVFEYFRIYKKG